MAQSAAKSFQVLGAAHDAIFGQQRGVIVEHDIALGEGHHQPLAIEHAISPHAAVEVLDIGCREAIGAVDVGRQIFDSIVLGAELLYLVLVRLGNGGRVAGKDGALQLLEERGVVDRSDLHDLDRRVRGLKFIDQVTKRLLIGLGILVPHGDRGDIRGHGAATTCAKSGDQQGTCQETCDNTGFHVLPSMTANRRTVTTCINEWNTHLHDSPALVNNTLRTC